jgi:hypothetical protein
MTAARPRSLFSVFAQAAEGGQKCTIEKTPFNDLDFGSLYGALFCVFLSPPTCRRYNVGKLRGWCRKTRTLFSVELRGW